MFIIYSALVENLLCDFVPLSTSTCYVIANSSDCNVYLVNVIYEISHIFINSALRTLTASSKVSILIFVWCIHLCFLQLTRRLIANTQLHLLSANTC